MSALQHAVRSLRSSSVLLRRFQQPTRQFCSDTPSKSGTESNASEAPGVPSGSPYQTPVTPLDNQKGVLQFIDMESSAGARRNGRAWRTAELRLKSFDDLHKLWYILLKERNVLLSERAWCKTNGYYWENGFSNLLKVKQSMARLKGVVRERERALEMKLRQDGDEKARVESKLKRSKMAKSKISSKYYS